MRLLYDENLSPRLVRVLEDLYGGSAHVHDVDLGMAADAELWEHALEHGLAIVSKDSDFHALSLLRGHPPKVIWIRRGNCTTRDVAELLRRNRSAVAAFDDDPDASVLVIE